MKLLISSILCFSSFTVVAQINNEEILRNRLQQLNDSYSNGLKDQNILSLKPKTYDLKKSEILSRQPGVYSLPQDGMPCIVPDTNGIAAMPNAFPNVSVPFKTTMPNVSPQRPLLREKVVK